VDHTTIWRWTQTYAPEVQRRLRGQLKPKGFTWHIDETFVKIAGRWMYLFRAVDSSGQTVDFYLSETRDRKGAKCFLQRALANPDIRPPHVFARDQLRSYLPLFGNCRKKAESAAVVGIEHAVTRIIASNPITDT
jgi:transposase-like protein